MTIYAPLDQDAWEEYGISGPEDEIEDGCEEEDERTPGNCLIGFVIGSEHCMMCEWHDWCAREHGYKL